MSPPIRDGSGNDIGAIRLGDGSEISEVRTGAGDVLFSGSAIPDSEDLSARYSFDKYSSTSGADDLSGNGRDLTNGSFTSLNVTINGRQAGEFLRSNGDDVSATFTDIDRPFHLFLVMERRSTSSNSRNFWGDSAKDALTVYNGGGNEYEQYNGGRLGSGQDPSVGDIVLMNCYFDDSGNDKFRLNEGAIELSGDAGDIASALSGLYINNTSPSSTGGDRRSDNHFGEMLIYGQDKRGTESEIENYLTNRWGPFSFA
jgi:hypothetical protein